MGWALALARNNKYTVKGRKPIKGNISFPAPHLDTSDRPSSRFVYLFCVVKSSNYGDVFICDFRVCGGVLTVFLYRVLQSYTAMYCECKLPANMELGTFENKIKTRDAQKLHQGRKFLFLNIIKNTHTRIENEK